MDREAWRAIVQKDCKSQTRLKPLNTQATPKPVMTGPLPKANRVLRETHGEESRNQAYCYFI